MEMNVIKDSPFRKRISQWGDCTLIVTRKAEAKAITLTKDQVYQTRFGALRHNDCYGQAYGSKVRTSCGFVHMLPFDPVIWSYSLPHRTQIIYPPDASLIVGGLDLVPGKRVMEAGTGSGSLTHFLVQAVWPTGCVRSFEFHAGRVERAAEEFQAHGLSNVVTVTQRDICADGFPPLGHSDNPDGVDAVSLDLPQPWLVVPSLPNVFRANGDGRICSFSPCIEQVQRTCLALKKAGFSRIQTVECLERTYDVVRAVLNVPNLGQVGAHKHHAPAASNQATSQTASGWWTNRYLLPPPSGTKPVSLGRKRAADDPCTANPDAKVARIEASEDSVLPETAGAELNSDCNTSGEQRKKEEPMKRPGPRDGFTWEALPQPIMPGHTGYLTFASWLPSLTRTSTIQQEKETAAIRPDVTTECITEPNLEAA